MGKGEEDGDWGLGGDRERWKAGRWCRHCALCAISSPGPLKPSDSLCVGGAICFIRPSNHSVVCFRLAEEGSSYIDAHFSLTDDSGGPYALGTAQSPTVRGTIVRSDSDGKKLDHLNIADAGDQLNPDPPKFSDLRGLSTATTSIYGRRLPPLGPAGVGLADGKPITSAETVIKERKNAGVGTGDGTLSSVVLTKLSSEQRSGVEAPSSSRERERLGQPPVDFSTAMMTKAITALLPPFLLPLLFFPPFHLPLPLPSSSFYSLPLSNSQQQSKSRKPPSGTFPTEVPDYSTDFSSDSEALPSSPRPAEGRKQSSQQPAEGGEKSPEDSSLRWVC